MKKLSVESLFQQAKERLRLTPLLDVDMRAGEHFQQGSGSRSFQYFKGELGLVLLHQQFDLGQIAVIGQLRRAQT